MYKYFPFNVRYFAKDNKLTSLEWAKMCRDQTFYIYKEEREITSEVGFMKSTKNFVNNFHTLVKNYLDAHGVERHKNVLDFEIYVFVLEHLYPDGQVVMI